MTGRGWKINAVSKKFSSGRSPWSTVRKQIVFNRSGSSLVDVFIQNRTGHVGNLMSQFVFVVKIILIRK